MYREPFTKCKLIGRNWNDFGRSVKGFLISFWAIKFILRFFLNIFITCWSKIFSFSFEKKKLPTVIERRVMFAPDFFNLLIQALILSRYLFVSLAPYFGLGF
jgi:hypothetical protein